MTGAYPYLVKSIRSVPRGLVNGTALALDPSQPRVSIYCREEPHEANPWFVASFVRNVYDGKPRWVASNIYPTADGSGFSIGEDPAGQLVGDKPADRSDVTAPLDPDFRIRYALECGTCGLRATRRADEMNGDLEKLYGIGVLEVSLRAFRYLGAKL